ncbi:hypothetical protein ES703_79297 [subsurface metagenome]
MNWKQKICLWVGIVVIVLMGIFPPTRRGYCPAVTYWPGLIQPGVPRRPLWVKPVHYGYTFLFSAEVSDIGFGKLIVQWAVVAVVTGGLIFIFGDKKDRKPKDEQKDK